MECEELPHLFGDWESCFHRGFMLRFGVGVKKEEFLICTYRDNLGEETSLHISSV